MSFMRLCFASGWRSGLGIFECQILRSTLIPYLDFGNIPGGI